MGFSLTGGAHCIAMSFYFLWDVPSTYLHHFIQILLALIGNGIGAGLLVLPNYIQKLNASSSDRN